MQLNHPWLDQESHCGYTDKSKSQKAQLTVLADFLSSLLLFLIQHALPMPDT